MGNELIAVIVLLFQILDFILFARVIFSWIQPAPGEALYEIHSWIYHVTEPLCAPFRALIPPMAGFDFSIIFVFLSLELFRSSILRFASGGM